MQAWICLHVLFLMNKTKDQISWVSSHDLYWENKMYKRKRSIRRISKQDMSSKRSAHNVTRSYFRHYCTEFLSNCCFPYRRKNSVSLTILLSTCNFKGLVSDFKYIWIEREISVGWRRIVATYLHIRMMISVSLFWSIVMLRDWSHDFAGYVINTVGLEDRSCR